MKIVLLVLAIYGASHLLDAWFTSLMSKAAPQAKRS